MPLDLSNPQPPPMRKDAPAKRGRPPGSGAVRGAAAKQAETARREEGLSGLFQLGGMASMMFGNLADAGACTTFGPNIARETAKVAETSAGAAKVVDSLIAVGPYAGLVTAILPFAIQLLVNHGRVPMAPMLSQIGVVDPATMHAKAAAELMRMQAQILADQADAESELREVIAAQEANA